MNVNVPSVLQKKRPYLLVGHNGHKVAHDVAASVTVSAAVCSATVVMPSVTSGATVPHDDNSKMEISSKVINFFKFFAFVDK